ncbi:MAG TPA: hypothetical protein VGE52_21985 [Pirellulales bacterium]
MELSQFVELLLFQTWWRYPATAPTWHDRLYSGFNLLEGAVWLVLAGIVLRRFLKHRKSRAEVAYALAFATFGLTDLYEAHALTSGLIALKGINLVVLLWLRSLVVKRHYPGRTF